MPAHKVDVGYMNPLDIKGIKKNCLCLNVNAIFLLEKCFVGIYNEIIKP